MPDFPTSMASDYTDARAAAAKDEQKPANPGIAGALRPTLVLRDVSASSAAFGEPSPTPREGPRASAIFRASTIVVDPADPSADGSYCGSQSL